MSENFDIEIPPAFEHLAMVRSVLSTALEAESVLKEERLQDLRLALSEAITNAIEAHNRSGTEATVRIRITVANTKVTVRVTDQGDGFDPSKLKKHPPVTDPERRLGVTLMRRLTDSCTITQTKKGTTVTLVVQR
jgi:serine/threonine-protein kinase RsbW